MELDLPTFNPGEVLADTFWRQLADHTVVSLSGRQKASEPHCSAEIERVVRRLYGRGGQERTDTDQSGLEWIARRYCQPSEPFCEQCPLHKVCLTGRALMAQRASARRSETTIPFIDLFCGAGGLSLGLERQGFQPVHSIDTDIHACRSYWLNRPRQPPKVQRADVSAFVEGDTLPKAPLLVGGPPCQGFSTANRQPLRDDPRNHLYREFLAALNKTGADLAVMENVPQMAKALPRMYEDFRAFGFEMHGVKLNAADFGVPQNRARMFLIAFRTDDLFRFQQLSQSFDIALDEYRSSLGQRTCLWDAISDLPPLQAKTIKNRTDLEDERFGYTVALHPGRVTKWTHAINAGQLPMFLFNHKTKYNNQRDIEIYRRLSPGENATADSIKDLMPYKSRTKIFLDKFYKLAPNRPCKTITAHMYYDCHMYIHPYQARGLTPREAARVQGFPDDYIFSGPPNEWYRQIGNAVSPIVGEAIGYAARRVAAEWGLA